MSALFGYLAEGLKYVMIFCDKITGQNYWLSLFLFALIIRLLMFPFGIKQQKNQQKLALLRPKEEAIRRKYKGRDDRESRQKMQQEIMEMQQKEKYSQFGGCLPMLIQLPIFFSLYYIVQNPLHYICQFGKAQIEVIMETFNRLMNYAGNSSYQNLTIKATGWLRDGENLKTLINALPIDGSVPTGAVDAAGNTLTNYAAFRTDLVSQLTNASENGLFPNFKVGFVDLAVTPNEQIWWYILVPIITFVILWATTKFQKKFTYQPVSAEQQGNSMKIMELMMPALSAFIAFSLPTALALYWIYGNVIGFGQQVLLSKLFPTHKMTDEEVREAMREADRQAYEQKKAEEKKKKQVEEEERVISLKSKTGTPEGWVEPMGPSSETSTASKEPKGKKNKFIGKAEIKDDKKDDE